MEDRDKLLHAALETLILLAVDKLGMPPTLAKAMMEKYACPECDHKAECANWTASHSGELN